jgi:hypothetical protein
MRGSWSRIAVVTVLALAVGACGSDSDNSSTTATNAPTTEAGPTVKITAPAEGATIKGNVVALDLEVTGFKVVKADGDTSGKTGHFHVFVDKPPVAAGAEIPKEAGVIHSTDDPLKVTGLHTGSHTLTVVLGDGTHKRIGNVQDVVKVTVAGPTVDASAPPTVPAGQPFTVDVVVEGVSLVKADGDTSGKTGHLHLFVDKEPVFGQPIPTGDPMIVHSAVAPITGPALTAGEHVLWVVVGDGSHTPLDPPVLDKRTIVAQ